MVANTAIALRREIREWKDRKRSGREGQVAHRQDMKQEIAQRLPPRQGAWPEAIIRDVSRLDAYPEADDFPWRISP